MKRTPNNFGPMQAQILPGDPVTIWLRIVDRRFVPALAALMAPAVSNGEAGSTFFLPTRKVFVTSNEDGTFSVLSDLRLIAPEASRMTDRDVAVVEIVLDPDDPGQEDRLRTFLAYIDPFRHTRTSDDFLEVLVRGGFDELVRLYAGERVHPRNFRAVRQLLCAQELPHSTFHRKRKLTGTTSEKRGQAAKPTESEMECARKRTSLGGRCKPRKLGQKAATPEETAEEWQPGVQDDLFDE